jgi:hypothetical protein
MSWRIEPKSGYRFSDKSDAQTKKERGTVDSDLGFAAGLVRPNG